MSFLYDIARTIFIQFYIKILRSRYLKNRELTPQLLYLSLLMFAGKQGYYIHFRHPS